MEYASLFTTIAEIAGVFVGFAALIGVTHRSETGTVQRARIQAVVTTGLLIVLAALVPVALESYRLTDRALWVTSSAAYLLLNWAAIALALRRTDNRRVASTQARETPVVITLFWALEVAVQGPLLLVLLGVNPALDEAFYRTALVVHLFEAAFVLAQLVYSPGAQRRATPP
jgi:hypothetical protein